MLSLGVVGLKCFGNSCAPWLCLPVYVEALFLQLFWSKVWVRSPDPCPMVMSVQISQNKAGRVPVEIAVLDSHDDGSAAALLVPTVSVKAVELDGIVDADTGDTLLHVSFQH